MIMPGMRNPVPDAAEESATTSATPVEFTVESSAVTDCVGLDVTDCVGLDVTDCVGLGDPPPFALTACDALGT